MSILVDEAHVGELAFADSSIEGFKVGINCGSVDDPLFARGALMDEIGFTPGVWRHYKGAEYLALGLAREDETDEVVVVYTRLYPREGLPMSTRRLSVWNQMVEHDGRRVPRFQYVGQRSAGANPVAP